MDGAYYRFIKDDEGNMSLQGRSRSVSGSFLNKIGHVPHLHEFFNSLPNGTCLLGEIYFPENEGSSNVTTIMGCTEAKAIARQSTGPKLHYYIFDVWAWDGQSFMEVSCETRFHNVGAFSKIFKNEYVEWAEYCEGAELWELLEKTLACGGEGIVMTKKGTHPEPGKRPARKTLKVKKELANTIDCIFTGKIAPPTKEYTGKEIETWTFWENVASGEKFNENKYKEYMLGEPYVPITKPYFHSWAGSLEIGLVKGDKVIPIGWLSGLSDEIKSNAEKYKGVPIEISAMEVLPTGGLRHAKHVKFRPDLTIKDCSWEKVFGEK
jgi:hypothetical protein